MELQYQSWPALGLAACRQLGRRGFRGSRCWLRDRTGVIDNPLGLEDPDNNLAKSFTGQVSWSNDKFGAALSGNWGELGGDTTGSIMDLVLSADPTDSLSLWLNFDWVNYDGTNQPFVPKAGGGARNNVNSLVSALPVAMRSRT